MDNVEKKSLRAIKIAVFAVAVSLILGIFSLWVVLNQVTISVGIDKKLIEMEARLKKLESAESHKIAESSADSAK
ncbi:DUF5408 family protein [Helicobacter sp. 23-1045]